MVRYVFLIAVFMSAMTLGASQASAVTGPGQDFGYYFRWLRDADGDGIPNGLDDDWMRPKDGDGFKMEHRHGKTDGVLAVTVGDGNYLRKQYRFRFDPSGDGERKQIHQRLKDGDCEVR
jgi:hypothetical protein